MSRGALSAETSLIGCAENNVWFGKNAGFSKDRGASLFYIPAKSFQCGNCHAKRSGTSKRSARSVAVTRLVFLSKPRSFMLVTLVAILCNGQLCLEKVVTNSEQSGITMTACQANAQIGIADWLANGPYHEWKLEGYKCVLGKYAAKHDA